MKKLVACTAALLLLLGTQTASADHRDRWDRGHSRHDHHYQHPGRGLALGHRKHDRHDRVSVNLNIRTIPDWRYRDYYRATSGLGIAYTTTWGAPYNTWNPRGGNTVIIHQNTYVDNSPRVVRRTTTTRGTTSLLRDVEGRCFERSVDGRGVETRIELPASNCNF